MWRAVDVWWAEVLRLPVEAVLAGGLHGVEHADHVGVMLGRDGRPPLIYAPPAELPALDRLRELGDDRVVDAVIRVLGARIRHVSGPNWHAYLASAAPIPPRGSSVRELTPEDIGALDELHEVTPRAEVNESGTDGLPAFGVFDGARLLSVACLKLWHGRPTVAVLTRPGQRGRGLGREVVAAAARASLMTHDFVQYRAHHDNHASIAIARDVGFSFYADRWIFEIDPDQSS